MIRHASTRLKVACCPAVMKEGETGESNRKTERGGKKNPFPEVNVVKAAPGSDNKRRNAPRKPNANAAILQRLGGECRHTSCPPYLVILSCGG